MSTLREFYEEEAGESLRALREAVADAAVSAPAISRPVRVLRGAALLAGDERVHAVTSALNESLRDGPTAAREEFLALLSATIDDLEALLAATDDGDRLDTRASDAAARWGSPRVGASRGVVQDADEIRGFAAREAAAITQTMADAVAAFRADPLDRTWLGNVLRHQRALLGSVQLETMPVVGESLRAVEDLTELIVHLDVPVKAEWLDIFRSARDVLGSAHDALERGETPTPVPALSRLRTLRDELLARYVSREPPDSIAEATDGAVILESDTDPLDPGAGGRGEGPEPAVAPETGAHEALARLLSRLEPPEA